MDEYFICLCLGALRELGMDILRWRGPQRFKHLFRINASRCVPFPLLEDSLPVALLPTFPRETISQFMSELLLIFLFCSAHWLLLNESQERHN